MVLKLGKKNKHFDSYKGYIDLYNVKQKDMQL